MSIIEFWQSSKSGHLVKRENDQMIVFLLENLYWEAFQNKFEVKNIPTSICNFGEKQNCFNIYNKCLSLITKVIKNKCNSDSKTNICNNYYSTSSDSVCLWKKKKSQSAPRGTKQLNFCWETEHKAINIWLVATVLKQFEQFVESLTHLMLD